MLAGVVSEHGLLINGCSYSTVHVCTHTHMHAHNTHTRTHKCYKCHKRHLDFCQLYFYSGISIVLNSTKLPYHSHLVLLVCYWALGSWALWQTKLGEEKSTSTHR